MHSMEDKMIGSSGAFSLNGSDAWHVDVHGGQSSEFGIG
jgi:hypothetical protein